jgi:hypothetical protein
MQFGRQKLKSSEKQIYKSPWHHTSDENIHQEHAYFTDSLINFIHLRQFTLLSRDSFPTSASYANQTHEFATSLVGMLEGREQDDTNSFKAFETWRQGLRTEPRLRPPCCYLCPGSGSWKQFLPWSYSISSLFTPYGILRSCIAFTRRKFRYPIHTHTSYHCSYLYNLPDARGNALRRQRFCVMFSTTSLLLRRTRLQFMLNSSYNTQSPKISYSDSLVPPLPHVRTLQQFSWARTQFASPFKQGLRSFKAERCCISFVHVSKTISFLGSKTCVYSSNPYFYM